MDAQVLQPRRFVKQYAMAHPGVPVTLEEMAKKSHYTEHQITTAIRNLKHDDPTFPLRVAETRARRDGRPGTRAASAWIYEPEHAGTHVIEPDDDTEDEDGGARTMTAAAAAEIRSGQWVGPRTTEDGEGSALTMAAHLASQGADRESTQHDPFWDDDADAAAIEGGEGYRWNPYQVAALDEPEAAVVRPVDEVVADLAASNGHRTYSALAVTRSGMVLVEDDNGEVYRLVKLDG